MKTGLFFLITGFLTVIIVACNKAESTSQPANAPKELPIKKTRDAYTKALLGRWRIDTDTMAKEMTQYVEIYRKLALERDGESEELTRFVSAAMKEVEKGIPALEDSRIVFKPNGIRVSEEDGKNKQGTYHFDEYLNLVYGKDDDEKVHEVVKFTPNEIVYLNPLGTEKDTVVMIRFRLIRVD